MYVYMQLKSNSTTELFLFTVSYSPFHEWNYWNNTIHFDFICMSTHMYVCMYVCIYMYICMYDMVWCGIKNKLL